MLTPPFAFADAAEDFALIAAAADLFFSRFSIRYDAMPPCWFIAADYAMPRRHYAALPDCHYARHASMLIFSFSHDADECASERRRSGAPRVMAGGGQI